MNNYMIYECICSHKQELVTLCFKIQQTCGTQPSAEYMSFNYRKHSMKKVIFKVMSLENVYNCRMCSALKNIYSTSYRVTCVICLLLDGYKL